MHDVTDAHMHIGWYNDETGQWDKPEPTLPAFMAQPEKRAEKGPS